MVFLFNRRIQLFVAAIICLVLQGCLSYEILKRIDGRHVAVISDSLHPGKTTLTQVLDLYGAPGEVQSLNHYTVLIYKQTVSNDRKLSFALPLYYTFQGYDISATGGLKKFDALTLVFSEQGVLSHYVYERNTQHPFFKTLFKD